MHSIEEDNRNIPFHFNDPSHSAGIMKDVLLSNKDEVIRKISLGKSVRVIDNNGKSLLHLAVQAAGDDLSMIDLLLQQEGIDINAPDFTGATPLKDSIRQKKSSVAICLIKAGANVNVPLSCTPLHVCIQYGLPDICEALIEAGADINAQDLDDDTPLHLAIHYNQFEIACMLLCYGPEMKMNAKYRPLTFSIASRKFDFADILLDFETEFEDSIVEYAVTNKYPNLQRLLLKIVEEQETFHFSPSCCFPDLLDNVNALEIIWKNFYIEDNFNNLLPCLLNHRYSNIDSIRIVSILKDSRQELMKKFVNYSWKKPFISQLILLLPSEDSTVDIYEVCATFLSHGLLVWDIDLDVVYEKHGFCELFQLLLHMDIRFSHYKRLTVTPSVYYLIEDSMGFRDIVIEICSVVVPILDYQGTLLPKDFQVLSGLTVLPDFQPFSDRDIKFQIPKLVELARNELRRSLCFENNIETSSQFYTLLKTLPFPNYVKKIISLETPLYYELMIPKDYIQEMSQKTLDAYKTMIFAR